VTRLRGTEVGIPPASDLIDLFIRHGAIIRDLPDDMQVAVDADDDDDDDDDDCNDWEH